MIKKVCLVLVPALSLMFYSCGSTKQEAENTKDTETAVEAPAVEEVSSDDVAAAEVVTADGAADGAAADGAETVASESVAAESDTDGVTQNDEAQENLDELYPLLEEIEEPEFIEITPEEIEQQEAAKAALEQQEEIEKNKITEPVEETEELPPLPEGEENLTGEAEDEQQESEETTVEPTIEIQPEDAEPEIVITPSRSVSLNKGETLVITYPGSGWIYMGSTSEYNNLASRGRKLGTTDTKYTLLAKEAGTQIHHFYKVDNLTGEYIDDYIEVTVLEKKGNSSTVVNAPDYSQVVPKKPETPAKATPKQAPVQKEETTEQTAVPTDTKTTNDTKAAASTTTAKTSTTSSSTATTAKTNAKASAPKEDEVIEVETEDAVIVIDEEETEETVNLEPLLEKARTGISSKKYDDAYTALTQYLEFSTDDRDEALYLLGQLLESDSQYKNIKQAVETYQTLCDSYPASKYWDQANKRIVYLKRFYINIH